MNVIHIFSTTTSIVLRFRESSLNRSFIVIILLKMVTFDTSERNKFYLMQMPDISRACEINSMGGGLTVQIVKNEVKSVLCFEFL